MPDTHVALWRRLACAAYDSLIVVALWFVGTALVMPLSRGAITPEHSLAEALYQLYLLAIGFAFFGGFWVRNGQTLGMLAWRAKVVRAEDGASIGWRQALIRYLAALVSWLPLGLGFWWSLWDTEKKTWHDRLSGTRLIRAASFSEISNTRN